MEQQKTKKEEKVTPQPPRPNSFDLDLTFVSGVTQLSEVFRYTADLKVTEQQNLTNCYNATYTAITNTNLTYTNCSGTVVTSALTTGNTNTICVKGGTVPSFSNVTGATYNTGLSCGTGYSVYINGNYVGDDLELIQINDGDTLSVTVYKNDNTKTSTIKTTTYFGKKLMEDKMYTKEPKEIYVEKLLVEKDKSYHIWGKIFSGDTTYDFWMPKSAIIKDNEVKNIVIDYSKYQHRMPMTHQLEAIEKLVGNKKFILADDMGLGKTTATIIAALETGAKKILVVCPASLKINWQREIENYSDRPVYIAEGKKFSTESDFVIVNYDILKNFHDTDPKRKVDQY